MTTFTFAEKTFLVSATGREPVGIQLQGTEPLTIRVAIRDAKGTGSYTDTEPPPSRR
jgi:hypothetical protein